MGEVWACHHTDDGRRGALKVLRAGLGDDALARFEREMLALGKLRHHAIVSLLDHDLSGSGYPWLVMEHIDGESLEGVIDRGPMPIHSVLRPFAALADGLAQAHAYGIHHRDVKANNVILQPDGTMVLVDFGAAIDDDSMQVTQAGMMLGTTRYLPPEVVCGEDRDLVSADIYALGMLLFEVLTGTHAFRGDDGALKFRKVLSLKMKTPHLDPGEAVPEEVRRVVRMATVADPDARLNRMDDLADLLEVAAGGASRTPMMSLRRSERISILDTDAAEEHTGPTAELARTADGAPAAGDSVPVPDSLPPSLPPPDHTQLRRQPRRSPADLGLAIPNKPLTPEGAPTVRLVAPDAATVRLQRTDPLDDQPPAGIDWALVGALAFLITGLLGSAGVLVLGLTVAFMG